MYRQHVCTLCTLSESHNLFTTCVILVQFDENLYLIHNLVAAKQIFFVWKFAAKIPTLQATCDAV